MSIDTARRYFQDGLGDAGTCTHATMTYGEKNAEVYKFYVTLRDGSKVIVEESNPVKASLTADFAKSIGATFAETRPARPQTPIVLKDGKAKNK